MLVVQLEPLSSDPGTVISDVKLGRSYFTRRPRDVVTERKLSPNQWKQRSCSLHPDQPYAYQHTTWYREYEDRGGTRKDWWFGWYEEVIGVRETYKTKYALMCDGSVKEEETTLEDVYTWHIRWQQITWWGSDATIGPMAVGVGITDTKKPVAIGAGPDPGSIVFDNGKTTYVDWSGVDTVVTAPQPTTDQLQSQVGSVKISEYGTNLRMPESVVDDPGTETFQARLVTIVNSVEAGTLDAVVIRGQFKTHDSPLILSKDQILTRNQLPPEFMATNSGLDAEYYRVVSFTVAHRSDSIVRDGITFPLRNVTVLVAELQ